MVVVLGASTKLRTRSIRARELFAGTMPTTKTFQRAFKRAAFGAGVTLEATPHTLRHARSPVGAIVQV